MKKDVKIRHLSYFKSTGMIIINLYRRMLYGTGGN